VCGIAGIVSPVPFDPERERIVRHMARQLAHRGPDGEGFARLRNCDLAIRRLAIVDPEAPAQPFSNETATVWSVSNGEIYNADSLRDWLSARGHRFRTGVDTEILPHLYEEMGAEFVGHLDGMYAFALYDVERGLLLAARDRAGEKPLFYWAGGGEFAFGSELRALLAHPRSPKGLDPVAIRRYLLHDCFPAPLTPIAGIRKLPAGHRLVFRDGTVELSRYWDLAAAYGDVPSGTSLERAARELDERIAEAVRRRKRGHAPVGVFLSGGIDSTTILAHLSEQDGPGVLAFTLGQSDRAFDESRFARETARRYRAELVELVVGPEELEEGLRRIADGFDEPLGDASTIPTHLLSLRARRDVKVVLSGEGGDELFAGYPTYLGDRLAERWRALPASVRQVAARAARALAPVRMGNVGLDYLVERFFESCDRPRFERHACWFGGLSPERHGDVLAPRVLARLEGDDPFRSIRERLEGHTFRDGLSALLYLDFTLYLQDVLLTKVDRASMLASLEARAPFLDHELAEHVARLPSSYKLRGFETKLVLRRAVRGRLPLEVLRRRKRGFNIPFSRWLLGGLGPSLQRRFEPERVRSRGVFSPEGVHRLLGEHLARRADHRKPLFSLLVFDLWLDRTYGDRVPIPLAEPEASRAPAVASAR